eukprot:m.517754 g.517754  ORF g.517754 m.517754 type:complete len:61 (+) comp57481_c1_seq8:887-1069(+)
MGDPLRSVSHCRNGLLACFPPARTICARVTACSRLPKPETPALMITLAATDTERVSSCLG